MTLYLARYLLPVGAPPIKDGALLVRNRRIAAIGRRRELLSGFRGRLVDFGAAVLLPPLVNAHTHLELTHFPLWAEQGGDQQPAADFVDWLLYVIRIKRQKNLAALSASLEEGLRRSLRFGTGAVGDILSCAPIRRAYAASPLYGRFFFEVLGRRESAWRPALKEAQRLFQEGAIARLQPGCAPHASYSLAARGLREIFALGRCRRWPLTTHFAESPAESHWLLHGGGGLAARLDSAAGWRACLPPPPGRNPTAYLEGLGGLYPGNLLVHGVQVNARDVQLLARRRVTLVLCPRSNERLGVGRAPVARYRATGVKLALGTDSLASNDSLSMWEELAAARRCYGPKLSPAELLAMATCNGADALGLKGEMGALRAGFGAHFQVLPLRDPPPLRELEEFLCSHGCDSLPSALYLTGRECLQSVGGENP